MSMNVNSEIERKTPLWRETLDIVFQRFQNNLEETTKQLRETGITLHMRLVEVKPTYL